MTGRLAIQWFYVIGFVFLACLLLAFYLENYYVAIIPGALLFLWLALEQTKFLLFFTVLAVPLSLPINDVGGGLGMTFPTEPIIILVFLGLILKLLSGKFFDKELMTSGLSLIILLDIVWTLLCCMPSSMPLISVKFFMSRLWYVSIFYFLFASFFKETKSIRLFIWLLGISTCVLAAYTLMNHAQGSFTRTYAYTAMRPFLPDHGMYAALVAFFVPPFFVFAIWGFYLNQNILLRVIAFCISIFLSLAVILSFTRAAWLSLVAAAALIFVITIGVRFRTFLLLLLAALGMYVFMKSDIMTQLSRNKQGSDDDIEGHFSSATNISTDPSNLERLNRWSCAYRMFKDRPVFGFGPGTYVFQYAPYQISSELTIISTHSGDLGNVHSEYLRPLCETGWPGALFWLGMVIFSLYLGFRIYRNASNNETKYMALALVSGISTYFVHGLLNNYSEFDKLAVPMWGFMAALTALNVYHLKKNQEPESELNPV